MENEKNENVTTEEVKVEENNVVPEENTAEVVQEPAQPETDVTGQPIVDDNSYVKTPEQIKAERKEKWKKLVFGDKTAEKKEPMDKQDILCYVGAVVCFLLALLPFLLRTFDPVYDRDSFFNKDKDKDKEEKVTYKKLHCQKTSIQSGYSYSIGSVGTYGNNAIEKIELTYTVTLDSPELGYDNIEIPEFMELSAIETDAITEKVEVPKYMVTIDMKNPDINKFKGEPPLNDYIDILPSQREKYTNDGYTCIIENLEEYDGNN